MARHRLFRPAEWTRRTVVFHILFQGIHLAIFGYGWYKQQTDTRLAILNKLRYSVWLSRGAALALSLDASLLVLPWCRQCLKFLWPKMPWLPLHDVQWFHQQVAYSLLFYTMIHVGCHYVKAHSFFNVAKLKLRPVTAVEIHYTQAGGITGHIMLLCMLLMFTTAHRKIRLQSYESFWYIHHLFIIFFLALLCHGTGCFVRFSKQPFSPFAGKDFWHYCIGYQSFRWELFPLTIYLFERIYRFYRSHQNAKVLAVFRHSPRLLEVRFEKEGMNYKAGQWLFVKFPDIEANQWHPFSISSCPEDPYLSIHIQQSGDFTGYFADAFEIKEENKRLTYATTMDVQELRLKRGRTFPRIRVDGPYGLLTEDVFRHEVAIIVGAGIGVTPWASILKSIWHLRNDVEASVESHLKRVEFIWICRDILHYKWLHELIMLLEAQSRSLNNKSRWPILHCRVFITRQLDPLLLQQTQFRVAGRRRIIDPELEDKQQSIIVAETASISSDTSSEPISAVQLQAELHRGRPDFVHELKTLSQEFVDDGYAKKQGGNNTNGGQTRRIQAGVYYCGPDTPGKALRDACVQVSNKDVELQFWKEHG